MQNGGMALLYALLCLGCLSCFRIRPVEPPDSSVSEWVSPTDYEILLNNLRTAIAQRNVQNYQRCFDPEFFRFTPAASLYNDNESIWQNWSLQDEQTWIENVFGALTSPSGNSLILEEVDLQDVTSDSLRYVGTYQLRMNHSDTSLTTLFQGQIQLLIRQNSFNEWEIRRWADVETQPDSSWSQLKLRYVQ
ncbi:MAG: hypothetical protein EAZ89_01645 [Bacteroidetes bacterium]|nr:MAG: hypothetical protein EAZ89_01645 [Bacteroidota bacterium]